MNCDAPYMASLLEGRITGLEDLVEDGDWQRVRAVAVGQDYASRSWFTIGHDGHFKVVVQEDSSVKIVIDGDDKALPITARRNDYWRSRSLGPFPTAKGVGEVKRLGTVALTAA